MHTFSGTEICKKKKLIYFLNVSWVANITCLLDKQSKSNRTQLFPPCFYEIVARG